MLSRVGSGSAKAAGFAVTHVVVLVVTTVVLAAATRRPYTLRHFMVLKLKQKNTNIWGYLPPKIIKNSG